MQTIKEREASVVAVLNQVNAARFSSAYNDALARFVTRRPEEYSYPIAYVPRVVAKMVPSLAAGTANVGPAVKAAARKLGLKPTASAIREFLTAP